MGRELELYSNVRAVKQASPMTLVWRQTMQLSVHLGRTGSTSDCKNPRSYWQGIDEYPDASFHGVKCSAAILGQHRKCTPGALLVYNRLGGPNPQTCSPFTLATVTPIQPELQNQLNTLVPSASVSFA